MKCYIGIDLGGTNVRVAKVTQDGEVLAQVKGPSYGTEGPAKVMANMFIRFLTGRKQAESVSVFLARSKQNPVRWHCLPI